MAFDLTTMRDLNFDNIGQWPRTIQSLFIILTALIILLLGFWFDTRTQLDNLNAAKDQEIELRQTYEAKQNQAVNRSSYKAQLDQMHQIFSDLLKKLPSRSDMPSLLEAISKQGVKLGLEFRLLKPLAEVQRQYYVQLPMQISVTGTYASLAAFISNVAKLPRIVTFNDFTISRLDAAEQSNNDQTDQTSKNNPQDLLIDAEPKLTMNITANIYRYDENNFSLDENSKISVTVAIQSQSIQHAQNLHSPFKPLPANFNSGFHLDFNRPKEALEAYSLDSLRLVGKLIGNKTVWSIVQAPDGSVHYVTNGDHLGEHYGKVTKIDAERIEIKEFIRNDEGGWEEHPTVMFME